MNSSPQRTVGMIMGGSPGVAPSTASEGSPETMFREVGKRMLPPPLPNAHKSAAIEDKTKKTKTASVPSSAHHSPLNSSRHALTAPSTPKEIGIMSPSVKPLPSVEELLATGRNENGSASTNKSKPATPQSTRGRPSTADSNRGTPSHEFYNSLVSQHKGPSPASVGNSPIFRFGRNDGSNVGSGTGTPAGGTSGAIKFDMKNVFDRSGSPSGREKESGSKTKTGPLLTPVGTKKLSDIDDKKKRAIESPEKEPFLSKSDWNLLVS